MRRFRFFPLAILLLLGASVPFAKQWRQSSTGNIEGLVMDQIGMPIAMASVQACNTMRGGCTGAISDVTGFYRIEGLAPGRYSLWAEARMHMSEWTPLIIVEEGQTTRHDILLRREIPTLSAQPAIVQGH